MPSVDIAPVRIGDRWVGPGYPAYLVAEIGINHNGNPELARRMLDEAKRVGADAAKLQVYRTEDFLSPDSSLTHEYVEHGSPVVESQYQMFKRCELNDGDIDELAAYAARIGLSIHATPTNPETVSTLAKLGMPVMKNGSDYLTHLPLVRAMGDVGLPAVLSLGMSTVAECDEAVRTFRASGNTQLILLLCTSSYPTQPQDVNLARLPVLAQVFNCLVGFSDHTHGTVAAALAAAMGACWIEKHFTLDKSLPGPDQAFSADPAEFAQLVNAVRHAESLMGNAELAPVGDEARGRTQFRLSCTAARSMSAGDRLEGADIAFQRPGSGIPPSHGYLLHGRTLARNVPRGHTFAIGDFI